MTSTRWMVAPNPNYNGGRFDVEGDIICEECGERISIKAPAAVIAEMRHLHFPPPADGPQA